jgi:hypothetical protein
MTEFINSTEMAAHAGDLASAAASATATATRTLSHFAIEHSKLLAPAPSAPQTVLEFPNVFKGIATSEGMQPQSPDQDGTAKHSGQKVKDAPPVIADPTEQQTDAARNASDETSKSTSGAATKSSGSLFSQAVNWISGAADIGEEVARGAAQHAWTQITEHPGQTLISLAEGAAVGVAVMAAAPIAVAFGASAATVAGITLASDAIFTGMVAYGGVQATRETLAAAGKVSGDASVLMDKSHHSPAQIEAARKDIAANAGETAIHVASTLVGAATSIGCGVRVTMWAANSVRKMPAMLTAFPRAGEEG